MKSMAIFFLLLVTGLSVTAQSVTFNADRYHYDNQTLLLEGDFGEWTNSEYVAFINQSGGTVSIRAHIHHHLTFIYFVDSENHADHDISINIPAGGQYTLRVIAKLSSGSPVVYNDQLGFDLTYQNGGTGYFELKASAYFHSKNSGGNTASFSKPSGYGYIGYGYKEESSGKPMRWDKSDFPLIVYSNHTHFGYSMEYSAVVQKAMNVWNSAGRSIGLNANIFELTDNPNHADIKMDWSGQSVPQGALGVAMPGRNLIGMLPLSRYGGLGAAGETLVQELGHLLGPVHSDIRYDVMNGTAHGHWHDLTEINLTERDRQMLGWIYSQADYYPFGR